jgi:hypothetical protein
MRKASKEELDILKVFFRTAGISLGLWDSGKTDFVSSYETNPLYIKNLEILRDLKTKKINLTTLVENCRASLKAVPRRKYEWISELIVEETNDIDRELLLDEIHFHHILKHIEIPSFTFKDGVISRTTAVPTVELVNSFTMNDLLEYYKTKLTQTILHKEIKSYVGQFNYLLSISNLDTILYAIDIAEQDEDGYKIHKPLDLQNYLQKAREVIDERMSR